MYRYNPYGYTHYGQYGFSPFKNLKSTVKSRVGGAKQIAVDPFGKRGGKVGIGGRTVVDPLKKRGGTVGIGTKSLSVLPLLPIRKPKPPPVSSAPLVMPFPPVQSAPSKIPKPAEPAFFCFSLSV